MASVSGRLVSPRSMLVHRCPRRDRLRPAIVQREPLVQTSTRATIVPADWAAAHSSGAAVDPDICRTCVRHLRRRLRRHSRSSHVAADL